MDRLSQDDGYLQVVNFKLGEEQFAFDISHVKEIVRVAEITGVPRQKYIEGVINLRGNVIPIIDLRKRFHLNLRTYNRSTRIIIVEFEEITAGFIVDAVLETKRLAPDCIEPPPSVVMGAIEHEYIAGVAKLEDRLLSLLHIDKILSFDEALKDG